MIDSSDRFLETSSNANQRHSGQSSKKDAEVNSRILSLSSNPLLHRSLLVVINYSIWNLLVALV